MAKHILNLFGALLLAAALAMAAQPVLAQDIKPCSKKVPSGSWHECGAAPADGKAFYGNQGSHEVSVFTTGPGGVDAPAFPGIPLRILPHVQLTIRGIKLFEPSVPPGKTGLIEVDKGDRLYVARYDRQLTSRTLLIVYEWLSAVGGDAMPFSETRMFVELNATTGDVGLRAFVDGEPWSQVRIVSPDQRIFQVSGVGSLGELGLTELSFATHELAREDLTLDDLLALFPEGEYQFRGRTVEGDRLLGTATLTHDIPDGPTILTPEEGALVDPDDTVISWDPVTEPAGIEIAGYRVSVERGDRGRTLSLDVPPEATSVLVPPDFLEPGTDYLFQVIAIEAGGNQTISEGVFDTAEPDDGPGDP